jgi:predicted metal-dependent hydrolase
VDQHALTQLLDGDILALSLPDPHEAESVRTALAKWYRRHAQTYFRTSVEHYSAQLGILPPRVFISSAHTRWGSCNAKGEVRLNWRLMQAAQPVIDYVVAHELAHLKELNHSVRFWRLVERIYPEFRQPQTELNAMTQHYMTL